MSIRLPTPVSNAEAFCCRGQLQAVAAFTDFGLRSDACSPRWCPMRHPAAAPFISYAPLIFVTPMLGAALGAYEIFRDWTKSRRGTGGVAIAEIPSIQVRLGRAAADLDVAELLLRRAVDTAQTPSPPSLALRARTMRDCARSAELCVSAIDALIAMSGTAAFAANHPIQRAWRDIHFASMHVSLSSEQNFAHFGRTELGLPRDSHQPFF
jgi:alkylation response protein AidB-like acyl-CoA dehydrogenase